MAKLENNFKWQGRTDLEDGQSGLRWHQVMGQENLSKTTTLLGFKCDLGVAENKGRVGAAAGPDAIRSAIANLAWHTHGNLQDAGNIVATNKLDEAQSLYAKVVKQQLDEGDFVIGLGGGHEIAWASYQGLSQYLAKHSKNKIGIINFDAHFDLRKPSPKASSGTPFRQIADHCQQHKQPFHYACLGVSEASNTVALFDYAKQSNTQYLLDLDCTFEAAKQLLEPMLSEVDELYVTVCLDAFPAHIAPGVSAPSALGIAVEFVLKTLLWIAASQAKFNYNWQLTDLAEMNPQYDLDRRTAKLAARIVYEIVKALNAKSPN
jgi:formiminoglutamase